MEKSGRYRAFVSYSHADAKAATWIQRALETYRIPSHLVGKVTPRGEVPRRLHPVFRDRDELAAAHSLTEELEDALSQSEALIVVCSPAAANSTYVAAEIDKYRELRDDPAILALLADGEPGDPEQEPFPEPLRADEPIAADIRPEGDGKRGALLKIVAGLTGLHLDDLIQRDAQRRARRMRWIAAAASLIALVMAGLSLVALDQRNLAQKRQEQAEGLVQYMLTDLREKLEPVGRLDVLDGVGERAMAYYGEQDFDALSPDALGRRSRALHLIGEVRMLRGDLEAALNAFRQSAATTRELVDREPDNGDRIFDHAQSVFWVGYVALQRGQRDDAQRAFEQYAEMADRLVEIDPSNDDWQLEVAYANSNLGSMALSAAELEQAERYFTAAKEVYAEQARRHPENSDRIFGLSQSQAWLADTFEGRTLYAEAEETRRKERETVAAMLERDPKNSSALQSMVVSFTSSSQMALRGGKPRDAVSYADEAVEIGEELVAQDPENGFWRLLEIRARSARADALAINRPRSALSDARQAVVDARALQARDESSLEFERDARVRSELVLAEVLIELGEPDSAVGLLDGIIDRLSAREDFPEKGRLVGEAIFLKAGVLAASKPSQARTLLEQALQNVSAKAVSRNQEAMAIRADVLAKLGRRKEANEIWAQLRKSQFRHSRLYRPSG